MTVRQISSAFPLSSPMRPAVRPFTWPQDGCRADTRHSERQNTHARQRTVDMFTDTHSPKLTQSSPPSHCICTSGKRSRREAIMSTAPPPCERPSACFPCGDWGSSGGAQRDAAPTHLQCPPGTWSRPMRLCPITSASHARASSPKLQARWIHSRPCQPSLW